MLRARLVILIALALSASIVVTASAAAAELPEFTVESGFTGTSGKVTLESKGGIKATCVGSSIEGTALSKRHGTFALTETECSTLGGAVKCTTSGHAAGTIFVSGEWSFATKAEKEEAFLRLTISGAAFSCGETAEEIKGSILAKITPLSTKTTKFELLAKETKGKPEFTEYFNDSGEKRSAQLLLSSKGGGFEEAGSEFASDKLTTAKETELKFGAVATVTVLPGVVIDLGKIGLNETKTAAFTYKVEAGSTVWWPHERSVTPLLAANEFSWALTKEQCYPLLWTALQTCKVEISLEAKVAGSFAEVQYEMIGGAPLVKVKGVS
jgi:hypothetical protein